MVDKARTKSHKSETVLVRTHLGLRRLPRYGYRDTAKGTVKLDRKTGDTYFIPIDGEPRRMKIGHESKKAIKDVY
ncbi:MAG: hypothetical protein HY665_07010 [Chloroflexi bacterium]|nr:hypothetical protein [Chloroflexota bacterium]